MITVIDCHAICHTIKHAMKRNEEFMEEFKYEGIIFGFLNKLLKYSKRINTDHFVFTWDSLTSKRKELYPAYKENRVRGKEEFDQISFDQFTQLREEVLPAMGFKNILYQEGYEGDDLIASVVNNATSKVIIVTSDNDLNQLLDYNTSIYLIRKDTLFRESDFIDKWHIDPSKWAKVKATAGDSGKNLKGVLNVGNKTAIAYIKDKLPITSKAFKSLASGQWDETIERDEKLLTLPYEGTLSFDLQEETLYFKDFTDVFKQLDFGFFLTEERLGEWVSNFSLR